MKTFSFWKIVKLGSLFQMAGLVLITLLSILLALCFPTTVMHYFDMNPNGLYSTVLYYYSILVIILFPFSVVGSWGVVKLFGYAMKRKNRTSRCTQSHTRSVLPPTL